MSELPNEGDYIRYYDDGTYEIIKIVRYWGVSELDGDTLESYVIPGLSVLYGWSDGAVTWTKERFFDD